jgi:hypothetical protein
MKLVGSDWRLDTTDVPTGVRSFRVVASAAFFGDRASTVMGPFDVLEGIGPFGPYHISSLPPLRTGIPWEFRVDQPSLIPGLRVRIQSAPTGSSSWTDLPGGGQMSRQGADWMLKTDVIPTGSQSFRAIASAPGYSDRIGTLVSGLDVLPELKLTMVPSSSGGRHILSLDSLPETKTPGQVFLTAVTDAQIQYALGLPFNPDASKLAAAIALAAEQYAKAEMQILADQQLQAPSIVLGPNASLELKGVVSGTLALSPGNLLPSLGGAVVAQGGGNLVHDLGTARLINQDGSGLINQDGSGLIHQDGSGLLGQDGSGLIGHDGSSSRPVIPFGTGSGPSSGRKAPAGLGPVQPSFTGLMTVLGDYDQLEGSLYIGIAGTNTVADGAQQFDQLVVSGIATLSGGSIKVGLFNPVDQTNRHEVFLPTLGDTFDVVVAKEIRTSREFSIRGSSVWGDGLFFKGSVVTRPDGMQALRFTVAAFPPILSFARTEDGSLKLGYSASYTDYSIDSASAVSPSLWSLFATGTNRITVSPSDSARFFRLSKPNP